MRIVAVLPFAVGGIDPQNVGLAVARDKLVFGVFETTGNIWSLPSFARP